MGTAGRAPTHRVGSMRDDRVSESMSSSFHCFYPFEPSLTNAGNQACSIATRHPGIAREKEQAPIQRRTEDLRSTYRSGSGAPSIEMTPTSPTDTKVAQNLRVSREPTEPDVADIRAIPGDPQIRPFGSIDTSLGHFIIPSIGSDRASRHRPLAGAKR